MTVWKWKRGARPFSIICDRLLGLLTLSYHGCPSIGELRTPYEVIMAASLLATLALVIAFLVFQRQFIQGITVGAVKG